MKTVAVRLTQGVGAIAVVLLRGPEAASTVVKIAASKKAGGLAVGGAVHTGLVHPVSGEVLDDGLLVRVAEDQFEVQVHGGIAVVDALMRALADAGVSEESPAERFGHDLAGEIALAMPRALTMTAARLVAAQESEGIGQWVRDALSSGKSVEKLCDEATAILERSKQLMALLDPLRIAIIGPPNAGKSTLANALLGRPVSIVSDTPGTTRDWVDGLCIFETANRAEAAVSVPIVLVDTAGIRETQDALEQISIERTHFQSQAAALILFLIDGSVPADNDETALIERFRQSPVPMLLVINKIDLRESTDTRGPGAIRISALHREGLQTLMAAALEKLNLHTVDAEEPFAFTARQRQHLQSFINGRDPSLLKPI